MKRIYRYNILSSWFTVFLLVNLTNCTTTIPIAATNNSVGNKKGVSKTAVLLGTVNTDKNLVQGLIVSNSEFGVIEAVENDNIEIISTVDMKISNYFFFKRVELIVNGQ